MWKTGGVQSRDGTGRLDGNRGLSDYACDYRATAEVMQAEEGMNSQECRFTLR